MLTRFTYLLFIISIIVGSTSCNPEPKNNEKKISVSIEPQKYLLEKLVGDKYKINTAIPSGSNPETYDPSPSEMVNIGKSQIYFKIGNLGFENTWLNNISLNTPNLEIIDCSKGISILKDDHGHANGDPHIWSSPKTILQIARNMYNAVTEEDPSNKKFYLENFRQVEKQVQDTDSIIKLYLKDAPSKSFIIYHPSLSYFAKDYELNQYSIEFEGKSPTPKQLAELIRLAKKENIKVIFIQKEYDVKNAEVIAKEIGAKIVQINPLSYNWDQELIDISKSIAGAE